MNVPNAYAPAARKSDREQFFNSLYRWELSSVQYPILAGDFNCVESPLVDRLGGERSEVSESETLARQVTAAHLADARTLLGFTLQKLELDPTVHFTFRRGNVAGRIDCFYIANRRATWLQWLQTQLPPNHSDHAELTLHLRDPAARKPSKNPRRALYPFRVNTHNFS